MNAAEYRRALISALELAGYDHTAADEDWRETFDEDRLADALETFGIIPPQRNE